MVLLSYVSWPTYLLDGHIPVIFCWMVRVRSMLLLWKAARHGWLVGGWATPLKHMKVSWDDELPNIWKNIKCSKPPTRWWFSTMTIFWNITTWWGDWSAFACLSEAWTREHDGENDGTNNISSDPCLHPEIPDLVGLLLAVLDLLLVKSVFE